MSGNAKIVNSGYCQQHHCGELDLNEKCVICYIATLNSKLSLAVKALEAIAFTEKDDNYNDARECVEGCGNEGDVWDAAMDVGVQSGYNHCAKVAATALKTLRGENDELSV